MRVIGVVDLRVDFLRQRLAVRVEPGADFGRDGEAGRHRQADARHFREVRALAAEQRLHLAVAVAASIAEEINQLALLGLGRRVAVAFGGHLGRGSSRIFLAGLREALESFGATERCVLFS